MSKTREPIINHRVTPVGKAEVPLIGTYKRPETRLSNAKVSMLAAGNAAASYQPILKTLLGRGTAASVGLGVTLFAAATAGIAGVIKTPKLAVLESEKEDAKIQRHLNIKFAKISVADFQAIYLAAKKSCWFSPGKSITLLHNLVAKHQAKEDAMLLYGDVMAYLLEHTPKAETESEKNKLVGIIELLSYFMTLTTLDALSHDTVAMVIEKFNLSAITAKAICQLGEKFLESRLANEAFVASAASHGL